MKQTKDLAWLIIALAVFPLVFFRLADGLHMRKEAELNSIKTVNTKTITCVWYNGEKVGHLYRSLQIGESPKFTTVGGEFLSGKGKHLMVNTLEAMERQNLSPCQKCAQAAERFMLSEQLRPKRPDNTKKGAI